MKIYIRVRNLIKILSLIVVLSGCSKKDDPIINPNINPGSTSKPIYFFQYNNLKSFNLDNQGGGTFEKVSNDELTHEIYGIAYDPSDGTLFGWTDYYAFNYSGDYYESYNPTTKERIKVKIGENTEYHSVGMNTTLNKKVLIKYDSSYFDRVIFQEISSKGKITFESPVIDLGDQVSKFIYNTNLDAFITITDRYDELKISVIDANTYNLNTVTINAGYPTDPIGNDFNFGDLNYDQKNDIIYYLRSNGLHVIDLNTKTAQLIVTDWIEFYQSKYGSSELITPKTIFYPPTNELIIQGSGFFGNSTGSSKFFAIDLTTKKAREIDTEMHSLSRVYGFATSN
jgi:hypothetical protein